ncbi:putative BOI-related E3 ubiquitin-protein ligase 2 [Camellia lanceoleosa]|uniref:BOI-related E3 ubiquitin-protein ligase 2 n=1 Tax=Camellia lanceoleosa TaxID=1840588 RepID=A0ACC0I0Y5_9ERIC|nr:putative BOI-related E3 ubiquitin-protein ligase 2 [Camellia lanceoleosa]
MEENHSQYDATALPQLQLFGDFPVGCSVDPLNYMATATNRPIKRARKPEPNSRQQKLQISLNNNFCQDEAGHASRILDQNPVSTGLKLSYEEDERNSSITSASEGMKAALPGSFSLSNSLKIEIDRQEKEFDHYIRLQEASIMKGIRELKQRQTARFLNAIEKGVFKKLQDKELEIENMNRKSKELAERIKQVATEAQAWHCRAKYNESVVNALKTNLQQAIAHGAVQAREGCGDSECHGWYNLFLEFSDNGIVTGLSSAVLVTGLWSVHKYPDDAGFISSVVVTVSVSAIVWCSEFDDLVSYGWRHVDSM